MLKSLITAILAALLLLTPASVEAQQMQDPLDGVGDEIVALLDRYDAPGLAVAIVQNGEITHTFSIGKRDIAEDAPVTDATQFGIGSVVKSFTSGLTGVLAATGQLDLKEHPSTYLSGFATANQSVLSDLEIRHLLSHTSGLPSVSGSLAFFPPANRGEMIERLPEFAPGCRPSDCWDYNNLNYILLDAIASTVTGSTKSRLMKSLLLEPAGMTGTLTSTAQFAQSSDAATGYAMVDGKAQKTAIENLFGEQIYATAPDLARWVSIWMEGGNANERSVLPSDFVTAATSMQAIDNGRPPSADEPDVFMFGYGYGWNVKSVGGNYVVHHGGNENGFSTHVLFVPAKGYGVVALTNQQNSILPNLVTDTVMRRLAGLERTPIEAYPVVVGKAEGLLGSSEAKLVLNNAEPLDLRPEKLVGRYSAEGYGEVSVLLERNRLIFKTPLASFAMVHKGGRRFGLGSTERVAAGVNMAYFEVVFFGEVAPASLTFNIAAEPVFFGRIDG